MSEAYTGEIRLFAFSSYAPVNWLACQGQTLQVQQYPALFSILGVTYGGDGQTTFKLPDLRGLVPLGAGQGNGLGSYPQGSTGGEVSHTLLNSEMPTHTHLASVYTPPTSGTAAPGVAPSSENSATLAIFQPAGTPPNTAFSPNLLGTTGGNQPHENRQPYLALGFCICIDGVYPLRPQ